MLGQIKTAKNATGIITKNPIPRTKADPLKTPRASGSLVSKNLLCR